MDRQAGLVSKKVNFKYLLISYGIFFGVYALQYAAVKLSAASQLYYELLFNIDSDFDSGRYGARALLYIAVLGVLICLITAPGAMAAASLVYRGINGIRAKGIGGFFGARAWLRSAAVYLPMMIIFTCYYHILLLYRLLYCFGFNFRAAANQILFILAASALYAISCCVYYSFAACDPSENISVRSIYGAGLKMAVRRFGRLILTAVLCAAAYYLPYLLCSVLFEPTPTVLLLLDWKYIAVGFVLNSLVLFAWSLIFYLVMFPEKSFKDNGDIAAAENSP